VLAVFKRRDARTYLLGQSVSVVGDSIVWLAAGIWVKTLTGSSAAAGLVFFAFTAPQLLAPFAGALVDRLPRRRLLLATNLAMSGVVLLLLFVHGRNDVWLIYAVIAVYGASNTIIGAGQSALLTLLLPEDLLTAANSALVVVREALRLVAPLLGAALFSWQGGHFVALVDAATFAVAAISLALTHCDEPPRVVGQTPLARELSAGIAHIRATPLLRRLLATGAVAVTVVGISDTVVYAIVDEGLHRSPPFIGVLLSVQGAGAVVGGIAAPIVARRFGEARLCAFGIALLTVAPVLLAAPALAGVLGGMAAFGAALPWILVALLTLLQRSTPPQLQGRVYAAAELAVGLPQTIAIALGAMLVANLNYRLVLALMATVGGASYLLATHAVHGDHADRRRSRRARTATDG